ncbi:hypothetical protein [Aromatoleum buckelii]|uniref:Uncharacterized protein n=1 Tax=Aromatoleum buckelii TaxID=200254 RepID=A0ABX1N605_9RHOO|nr:hypothetical protein [Aromatoleum buckelii]MCK0509612.1 hypothetical protein [Aromatoleum buckelii]
MHDKPKGSMSFELVWLGKASCCSTIDRRLYDHFPWNRQSEEWVPLPTYYGYDENKFIHPAGFPKKRAFEAVPLKEYFIGELNPRFNQNGRPKPGKQLPPKV